MAMELGQLVRSSAILGAGSELPPAALPADWAGQPGTRAPHVWIDRGGQRLSTLDLFTQEFTLITANSAWIDAATKAAATGAFMLLILLVGRDVVFPSDYHFGRLFGVGGQGASLVRPDGIVAWRSDAGPDATADNVGQVMRRVAVLPPS